PAPPVQWLNGTRSSGGKAIVTSSTASRTAVRRAASSPAWSSSARRSPSSTRPPGNAHIPPYRTASDRSTSSTSSPPPTRSRRGTTVAPGTGGGGSGLLTSQALVHELLHVDDDPGDLAGGDEAPVLGGGAGEREPAALDLVEPGLGLDRVADGGRGQVVELDPHPDRGVALGHLAGDGGQRGLLAQGDKAGRGQHGHLAAAQRLRGVGVADG